MSFPYDNETNSSNHNTHVHPTPIRYTQLSNTSEWDNRLAGFISSMHISYRIENEDIRHITVKNIHMNEQCEQEPNKIH